MGGGGGGGDGGGGGCDTFFHVSLYFSNPLFTFPVFTLTELANMEHLEQLPFFGAQITGRVRVTV